MSDSIAAYDVAQRIVTYDADMDVMHPNRHKMVDIALELLPFDRDASLRMLDLGVGTGFFSKRLLDRYPNARVIAVDGASTMIEVATKRLGQAAERIDFRVGDFRELDDILTADETGHLVISSYALHHLDAEEKTRVITRGVEFLEPGGWFLNADVIVGATPKQEQRFQELRVEGIVSRADADDPRVGSAEQARAFLDRLEATEGDQPLPVEQDLAILRSTNLSHVGVYWLEYREAVTGGIK